MSRSAGFSVIVLFIVLVIVVFSSGCINSLDTSCGNKEEVDKEFTLTKEQYRVQLDTPDASKDCHAVMYLQYEYQNQDLKQTKDKPPIEYEFGTTMGWFPNPISKMESRNDSGNKVSYYWYATTSQGAKNEAGDSTRYHILAGLPAEVRDTPAASSGILVKMKIEYVPVKTG
jgi:hypothetical protein